MWFRRALPLDLVGPDHRNINVSVWPQLQPGSARPASARTMSGTSARESGRGGDSGEGLPPPGAPARLERPPGPERAEEPRRDLRVGPSSSARCRRGRRSPRRPRVELGRLAGEAADQRADPVRVGDREGGMLHEAADARRASPASGIAACSANHLSSTSGSSAIARRRSGRARLARLLRGCRASTRERGEPVGHVVGRVELRRRRAARPSLDRRAARRSSAALRSARRPAPAASGL